MDIKAKIEEIVKKLQSDKTLLSGFQTNPVGTVEKLLGVDLPDDTINKLVEGVKAKLGSDELVSKLDADGDGKLDLDDAKKALGGILGKFKK